MSRWLTAILALSLLVAACGDDNADVTTTAGSPTTTEAPATTGAVETTTTRAAAETTTSVAADPAPDPPADGGEATFTVGGETYEFDSVLCAFGPKQIGQEGAEFVLSAIDGDLQLYVSIDSFGHSVSLFDIEDFDDPSVSWTADSFLANLAGAAPEFVEVSGTAVSAEGLFDIEATDEEIETVPGTLAAVCP